MPKSPGKGPHQIRRDEEDRPLYEPAYSLVWPVFPVKLSRDPKEIRAALNETFRYAKDPEGVGEYELNPSWAPSGPAPGAIQLDEIDLMDGYVIPTSTEPLRTYNPFEERPRVLDQAYELKLGAGANWEEQTLGFIEKYGFVGSHSALKSESWRFGEPIGKASSRLQDLQHLAESWRKLKCVGLQSLTRKDVHYEFNDEVDRLALSELIVEVNIMLRDGVFPTLRVAARDWGRVRFTTGFTCQTLLSALYLQLYWDITGSREYARCRGCGSLFGQGRPNQKFCSKHCGDSHRQRQHRERKRMKD